MLSSRDKTFTLEELSARTDALALAIGAKVTASTIFIACIVVILIGAQALLSTMQGMERDVNEMNKQLAIANAGLVVLNETMDAVPPTADHVEQIVDTVQATSDDVKVAVTHIDTMQQSTGTLNEQLGAIAGSTSDMRESHEQVATDTTKLATTIGTLDGAIDPLVKTQHDMLLGTRSMRRGIDGMNASLAYVVRILNYMTAPPTGGGMTIRADLPKQTLPPIPGLKAEVDPIPVFPRNIWPIYTGP